MAVAAAAGGRAGGHRVVRDGGIRDRHPTRARPSNRCAGDRPEPAKQSRSPSILATDGDSIFDAIAWREGMTVADLNAKRAGNDLKLDVRGIGRSRRFLRHLDGVANEGADGRNWMYNVNGKPGDRSFAVYELRARRSSLVDFRRAAVKWTAIPNRYQGATPP